MDADTVRDPIGRCHVSNDHLCRHKCVSLSQPALQSQPRLRQQPYTALFSLAVNGTECCTRASVPARLRLGHRRCSLCNDPCHRSDSSHLSHLLPALRSAVSLSQRRLAVCTVRLSVTAARRTQHGIPVIDSRHRFDHPADTKDRCRCQHADDVIRHDNGGIYGTELRRTKA